MMGYGRTAKLEQSGDVVDADFLAGIEYQEDMLARGVAEREKNGRTFPNPRASGWRSRRSCYIPPVDDIQNLEAIAGTQPE